MTAGSGIELEALSHCCHYCLMFTLNNFYCELCAFASALKTTGYGICLECREMSWIVLSLIYVIEDFWLLYNKKSERATHNTWKSLSWTIFSANCGHQWLWLLCPGKGAEQHGYWHTVWFWCKNRLAQRVSECFFRRISTEKIFSRTVIVLDFACLAFSSAAGIWKAWIGHFICLNRMPLARIGRSSGRRPASRQLPELPQLS